MPPKIDKFKLRYALDVRRRFSNCSFCPRWKRLGHRSAFCDGCLAKLPPAIATNLFDEALYPITFWAAQAHLNRLERPILLRRAMFPDC